MSKRIAAALLFVFLGMSAAAAGAAEVTRVAVDWSSLSQRGELVEVWLTRDFDETIRLGHDLYPHRSQRMQYAIDCEDRTYTLSRWLLTDAPHGAGNVVWEGSEHNTEMAIPVRGSLEASMVEAACAVQQTATLAQRESKTKIR